MTNEQILKLAETCECVRHISKITHDIYWECDEIDLLKFAQEIRKQTIDEILTTLEEVPNPEANRTAINRIRGI